MAKEKQEDADAWSLADTPDEYGNDKLSSTVPGAGWRNTVVAHCTSHIPPSQDCEELSTVLSVLLDSGPDTPPRGSATQKQTRPRHNARSHARLPNWCTSQNNLSFDKTKVEDPSPRREFISDSLGISLFWQRFLPRAAKKISLWGFNRS